MGAFFGCRTLQAALEAEFAAVPDGWALPTVSVPDGLSATEARHAYCSLRGQPLRVEVYGEDADPAVAARP